MMICGKYDYTAVAFSEKCPFFPHFRGLPGRWQLVLDHFRVG